MAFLVMLAIILVISVVPNVLMTLVQSAKPVSFGTSGIYQEDEVRKTSEEVIALISAGSFREVVEKYAEENTNDNIVTLEEASASVAKDWGEYKETVTVALRELKQLNKYYASLQAEVIYENVTVNFEFVYGEGMKLVGITMKNAASTELE